MTPTPNPSPKKIVIIGGGFAGFWAALAARRVAGTQAEVTVVSPQPVLEIRPRLYEARPETLGVDLMPLLRKVDVRFVRGEAIRLDTAAKTVTLAAGDHLAYDRLVVATGSRMRRPPVPAPRQRFPLTPSWRQSPSTNACAKSRVTSRSRPSPSSAPALRASSSPSSCATGSRCTAPMERPNDCASS
jgi:NADPH-dependent 2,4-dienoyl-CoA reductase/sulfur reductase-like enzyme